MQRRESKRVHMDNLYQTPSASLLVDEHPRDTFFVTATHKLYVLFFLTLGFYSVYWAYKHWDSQRAAMRPKKISPAARSIFHIVFIHSLCRLIAAQLQAKGLGAWKYSGVAWLYIVLVFASNGLARFDGRIGVTLEILLLLAGTILPAWPLALIQEKANLVSNDPAGERNSHFSLANYLCMLPGALLWLLIIIGSYI